MRKILTLCSLLVLGCLALAQSDTGRPVFQAFQEVNSNLSVNLGNMNFSIHAPVHSKHGTPLPLDFVVAANVQMIADFNGQGVWKWDYTALGNMFSGTNYIQGGVYYNLRQGVQCSPTDFRLTDVYTFTFITDTLGTLHPVNPVGNIWDTLHCKHPVGIDSFTTDQAGLELVVPATGTTPSASIYDNNGIYTNTSLVPSLIQDQHGNHITVAEQTSAPYTITYIDQLSATPIISYPDPNHLAAGSSMVMTYKDAAGTNRNVTVSYQAGGFSPNLSFSCSTITDLPLSSGPFAPTSITYPDSSHINMTWEKTGAYFSGRLSSLQVREGATYTLRYSGGTNNQGIWCPSAAGKEPRVATVTVASPSGNTVFARTEDPSYETNNKSTTTVTTADGSKTVYSFVNDFVVNKIVYDTNGTTVLDTVTTCYDSTISSCNPSGVAQPFTWVRQYHYVPGVANPAETDTEYNNVGNVLEADRFDFGPTLASKTINSYGSWSGSTCASLSAIHISNRLCDTQTQDSGGHVMSHSRFTYNTSTGDLLNTYSYTSTTANLTTTMTYNPTGTMATSSSVDSVLTTFGYLQCNGFLPDHATTSVGTVSMTWDCNGGVPLSATDLNGLTTFYAYNDPLYRITDISDDGGQTDFGYTYTSPTRFSVGMSFNSGNSIVSTTTTLNSQGQVLSKQHPTGPGSTNYDTVSYTYDSVGRVKTESQACTATLGAMCSLTATTYAYDGTGRPLTVKTNTPTNGVITYSYPAGDVKMVLSPAPTGENNKTVQIEKDGLGRTIRVCAVTGLGGSGSCGERTAATGYLTLYTPDALDRATQVSENAQAGATPVNSNFVFDFLGRPTSATFPESGTKTYVYDTTASSCTGSTLGHLTKSTDANGDIVCHQYDSMGRLSNIQYVNGHASVTPQKYFVYDGAGSSLGANVIGKVSAAFTCFSPCTTHQTNYNFGYDLYGRETDVWQNTPLIGAGNWYHTTASYWDNNALKSLSGIPGLAAFNYGLDGEGRPNTTTSGSGTYVSSVAYDSADNPTGIDYGNGDSDAYAWDAVTGKMTQYLFTVGAGQNSFDYGALTWNPNGTLQSLAITDHFSTSDTQTCIPSHDDLVRIKTYNCGAIFNETYAYPADYSGNVTKSGTISFAPGYTASNNRMLAPYTYDANGNLLNDSTLGKVYTYDSDNNIHSVSGTSLVYDAFDRNIEPNSVTDILYSPVGRIGWVGGLNSPVFINLPLSGGSSVTFGSTVTAQLEHYDFMGSVRLTSGFASRGVNQIFAYGPSGEPYIQTPNTNQVVEGAWQDTTVGMFDSGGAHSVPNTSRVTSPSAGANGYVMDNSPF